MVLLNLLLAVLFSIMRWSPDGDGGDATTDGQSTDDKKKDATPAAASSSSKAEPGTTFSQEQVNQIVKERLDREKGKYADYDAAKEKAAKWDEQAETQKSDLDKANERADKAEAKVAETIVKAQRILAIAEIRVQATARKVRPEVLDMLVAALGGSEAIKVTDEGIVEGVDKVLDEYLKGKDFLLVSDKTPPPGQSGAEFSGKDAATMDEQIREAESKGDWRLSNRLKLQKARSSS